MVGFPMHRLMYLCLGLLDPNETPEMCALRELKEETGYTGEAKHTSPRKIFVNLHFLGYLFLAFGLHGQMPGMLL